MWKSRKARGEKISNSENTLDNDLPLIYPHLRNSYHEKLEYGNLPTTVLTGINACPYDLESACTRETICL